MSGLRVPVFLAALVLIAIAVVLELGSIKLLRAAPSPAAAVAALCSDPHNGVSDCLTDPGRQGLVASIAQGSPTPGRGIPTMALVDGLLLFVLGMMALSIVAPARVLGRVQGLVSLIASILLIIVGIALFFTTLGLLILMVSLLLSPPFGTLAYLAAWGFFDRTGAAVTLSLLMLLKVGVAVCLTFAHQSFVTDKGLVLMVVASLIVNLVVAFLHGLVPLFLVSITDAVAAVVVAVIGILLAILLLIGAVVGVLKALQPEV